MVVRTSDALPATAAAEWGALARPLTEAAAPAAPPGCVVLEPPDAPTLAAMLRWADAGRVPVVPRGAGTRLAGMAAPAEPFALLSTLKLTQPFEHCAGDLTATLGAGIGLADANARLAAGRQWLPLDPPAVDRTTIGGMVAANDSGPRRLKHGTPRDLIIGITVVLADGSTARGGGRVVKNVAGYDLPRLFCGSQGALAVIVGATFKLAPCPPASRTMIAAFEDVETLAAAALALAASPLAPSAVELAWPPTRLLVRFETTAGAAEGQARRAGDLCRAHGATVEELAGAAEEAAWRGHDPERAASDTRVKLSVLPASLPRLLTSAAPVASAHGVKLSGVGRATLGVIELALAGEAAAVAATIDALGTEATNAGGTAVVLSAPPAVRLLAGAAAEPGDAWPMMQAVKDRFDPHHTLRAGLWTGGR